MQEAKRKFKVGDRVRWVGTDKTWGRPCNPNHGEEGTIEGFEFGWLVDFPSVAAPQHYPLWGYADEELELVDDT